MGIAFAECFLYSILFLFYFCTLLYSDLLKKKLSPAPSHDHPPTVTGRLTFSLCGIYFSCQSKGEAPGVGGQGRSQDFSKGGSHCVKHYRLGVFATEYCRLFA